MRIFSIKNIIKAVLAAGIILTLFIYCASSADLKIYLVTEERGIILSENSGRSWSSFNKGLPDKVEPLRLYRAGNYLYLTTWSSGLYRSEEASPNWVNISSPDFKTRSIYFDDAEYRKISAFNFDPENPDSLVIATKHTIYRSENRGDTWIKLPRTGLHERNYITALSVTGKRIYAGTSFNGIYEFNGSRFTHAGKNLPGEPYSGTLTFTEQVTSLFSDKKMVMAGFFFGSGIYSKNHNAKTFQYTAGSEDKVKHFSVDDISIINGKVCYTSGGEFFMSDENKKPLPLDNINSVIKNASERYRIISATVTSKSGAYPALSAVPERTDSSKRSETTGGKNSIYLSVSAVRSNLNRYIKIANETEINAFVIDMKDDFGNIYFPSKLKTVTEIRSQRNPVNVKHILKTMKENNIYSIARIVVFKDNKMYQGYNSRYAIKNRKTGKPWKGTEHEYWVDPHSEFVHDYNIGLAKELAEMGFDEIQFDYIRFPSDGPIHLCNYTHRKDNDTYKSEIMVDFLKKAKKNLNVPVSVDIYGFNSWYHFGNWIGQDMEALSRVVDVISPMVYPSHFGRSFYMKGDRAGRSYRIVYDGGKRAMKLIDHSVHIRPYLQAFNLLSPTWGPGYINNQINAAKESGLNGYTLWNARGDYDTPFQALKNK
jgi:hypothetical protein